MPSVVEWHIVRDVTSPGASKTPAPARVRITPLIYRADRPLDVPRHQHSADPPATPHAHGQDNLGFAAAIRLTPYLLVLFSAATSAYPAEREFVARSCFPMSAAFGFGAATRPRVESRLVTPAEAMQERAADIEEHDRATGLLASGHNGRRCRHLVPGSPFEFFSSFLLSRPAPLLK